jgi:hypothetical protein
LIADTYKTNYYFNEFLYIELLKVTNMKKIVLLFSVVAITAFHIECEGNHPETRDPLKWPFSQTSIWNMPIGSGAVYVHAQIEKAVKAGSGMTIDEDYIVMSPDAPLMEIYENNSGWSRTKSRCTIDGKLLFAAPIPQKYIVSRDTWVGDIPNSCLAVLMKDKRTIKQTQPFAHCTENQPGTSKYVVKDVDIYGDGISGAHGGSGLSAVGGTLRVGELTPNSGPIRHALKVNIFGRQNIYYDTETKGFRWPAIRADGYAADQYYKDRTNPVVKACRMGSLLALPARMNLDSLSFETTPGRILAQAFQDYGAYLVDDTAWDVYAIETEWSPEGRVKDEFLKNWGFSISTKKDTPWGRDMDRIFLNLHVVDNNSSSTIGGGGKPRVSLAPPFDKE